MISISVLADEIVKIDEELKTADPQDEKTLVLRGAVQALRWTMYPDVVERPTNPEWLRTTTENAQQ